MLPLYLIMDAGRLREEGSDKFLVINVTSIFGGRDVEISGAELQAM